MTDILTMNSKERHRAHIMRLITAGQMTVLEASEELGISERQCYRVKAAFLAHGDAALVHGLRGKPSNFRYVAEARNEVLTLIRRCYPNIGPTLVSELLADLHDLLIDPETLRRWMMDAGLWQRARKGHKHRRKRPRRSTIGELVQFDGSHHDWLEGRGPRCCLFVFIDDASSRVLLRFAPNESEQTALAVLSLYVRRHGIPAAFYIDRHSAYWMENGLTQVARAAQILGIRIIYAQSPQAKGRVERANRTQQDRLVTMMRLANITSIDEANAFLDAGYIDGHNQRFASTEGLTDVHRDASPYDLDNIICHEEERHVYHDMTIRVRSSFYQLLPVNDLLPLPRQRVIVRHWLDGSMHVFWREKELAIAPCAERPARTAKPIHPAENHPWRCSTPIGKARKKTIAELCRKKRA